MMLGASVGPCDPFCLSKFILDFIPLFICLFDYLFLVFQQFWGASLVTQLVKNLPAMRETWVQSLDWEDPLDKGKTTHPSILAWRIPWTV